MPDRPRSIYVIGGRNQYLQLKTIERYDIGVDRWIEIRTQLNEIEIKENFSTIQGGHHVYIFGSNENEIQTVHDRYKKKPV